MKHDGASHDPEPTDSGASPVEAEALFASRLQISTHPTEQQIEAAVAEVLRVLGSAGCADRLAQEYGDHPEAAAARMAWALAHTHSLPQTHPLPQAARRSVPSGS